MNCETISIMCCNDTCGLVVQHMQMIQLMCCKKARTHITDMRLLFFVWPKISATVSCLSIKMSIGGALKFMTAIIGKLIGIMQFVMITTVMMMIMTTQHGSAKSEPGKLSTFYIKFFFSISNSAKKSLCILIKINIINLFGYFFGY